MNRFVRSFLLLSVVMCTFCVLSTSYVIGGNTGKVKGFRVFTVSYISIEEAQGMVSTLLSPQGRVSANKRTGTLLVKDNPENLRQIEQLLAEIDTRPVRVRVTISFLDESDLSETGLKIKWRYTDSHWSVGNIYKSRKHPGKEGLRARGSINQIESKTVKRSKAFLVVMSGRKGAISVGKSFPYRDWFYSYSRHHGYYQSVLRFKQVKTGFSVEPIVRGDNVNLTITPELSYVTNENNGNIKFTRLSTTVDLKDGEEIVLGSSKGDTASVITRFLGGIQKTGKKTNSLITLRVDLE